MFRKKHRLRTQFEPSTGERRQLKRLVYISRKSMEARSVGEARSGKVRWRLRGAEAAVHLKLLFGLMSVDRQTQNVAACFYALLLKRKKGRDDRPTDRRLERVRWWVESRRRKRIRQHALFHLKHAVEDAGVELPVEWVSKQDPELDVLRTFDEWANISGHLGARG